MLKLAFDVAFEDLYSARGLAHLDQLFLGLLVQAAPALHARLEAARADPQSLARKAESELLLELAPHVEGFIGRLFGIEAEVQALADEHLRLSDLYSCKRQFVQRRATNRVKPEQAAPRR